MKPNYRFIARAYAWCERAVFGEALQRCRSAFINDLPQRVLSIGEGDGRFSEALLKAHPEVELEIVEPDAAMRNIAQERVPGLRFVDLTKAKACDAAMLNFVLDLFSEDEAHNFLDQLPDPEILIVGDFFPEEVEGRVPRALARTLVWIMYRFFALTAGTQTMRLPPTHKILSSRGWVCTDEKVAWLGLIRAQWWQRDAGTKKEAQS